MDTPRIQTFKRQAKELKAALHTQGLTTFKHGHALSVVTAAHGQRDWNTLLSQPDTPLLSAQALPEAVKHALSQYGIIAGDALLETLCELLRGLSLEDTGEPGQVTALDRYRWITPDGVVLSIEEYGFFEVGVRYWWPAGGPEAGAVESIMACYDALLGEIVVAGRYDLRFMTAQYPNGKRDYYLLARGVMRQEGAWQRIYSPLSESEVVSNVRAARTLRAGVTEHLLSSGAEVKYLDAQDIALLQRRHAGKVEEEQGMRLVPSLGLDAEFAGRRARLVVLKGVGQQGWPGMLDEWLSSISGWLSVMDVRSLDSDTAQMELGLLFFREDEQGIYGVIDRAREQDTLLTRSLYAAGYAYSRHYMPFGGKSSFAGLRLNMSAVPLFLPYRKV